MRRGYLSKGVAYLLLVFLLPSFVSCSEHLPLSSAVCLLYCCVFWFMPSNILQYIKDMSFRDSRRVLLWPARQVPPGGYKLDTVLVVHNMFL